MEAASKSRRAEPRRRISGDQRRESILQLTSRAFAEGGYDGVRTAELAASAGVSEALIYQHFRTKAELYRAAVDRSADLLEERIVQAAAPGRPVEERLQRAIDAFFGFVAEPGNAWTVLTLNVSDPELGDYQRELRARAIGGLLSIEPRRAIDLLKNVPTTVPRLECADTLIYDAEPPYEAIAALIRALQAPPRNLRNAGDERLARDLLQSRIAGLERSADAVR